MGNSATFNADGTWIETKAAGCSFSSNGTWTTLTINGKNILKTNYYEVAVSSFDCSQITGDISLNGITYTVTTTKQ